MRKRLANKAGARRVGKSVCEPISKLYDDTAHSITRKATAFMRHDKRKTLSLADVRAAIEAEGGWVYGGA